MSSNDGSNSNDQIVDAIKDIVPVIYDDALKPASKEIGKALGTLGKTVNMALSPISAVVWGYEQIESFVVHKVSKKLENVSEEDIITPDATIAGPLLESLRYTGHKEELQEMYANLLASSMNKKSADNAHPSFVEVIKQLTPMEAKIIDFLSKREEYPLVVHDWDNYDSGWSFSRISTNDKRVINHFLNIFNNDDMFMSDENYIMVLDNLLRLKILHISTDTEQKLEDNTWGFHDDDSSRVIDKINLKITVTNTINFTEFGKNFVIACVTNS